MFGKKNKEKNENLNDSETISVQTMPADFYGGQNPVIKFKKFEKEVAFKQNESLRPAEKKILEIQTAAGGAKAMHPANFFTSPKKMILLGLILLVLFSGGAVWYYWRQGQIQQLKNFFSQPPVPIKTPESAPVITPAPTPIETITPATTTEPVVTTTTVVVKNLNDIPVEFPSKLLADNIDFDKDGLTDAAETNVFQTDIANADTDGDTYNDGKEVYNLYSPINKAPVKLVDSGLINEFVNPNYGYKIYYPKNWAMGSVDENYQDVLFSTLNGENIEVRVFDKNANETFADWFGRLAPGENYSDLKDFTSVFKEKGKQRSDGLVYYFEDNSKIYVLVYHVTDDSSISYRSVIQMLARSFRLNGNGAQIKPQTVYVSTSTATTTE